MSKSLHGMTYLPNYPERYAEVYQTFTECTGVSGEFGVQYWISSTYSSSLSQRLKDIAQKPNPLRVLSVGSGDGNIDCAILEKVLPSFPQICNTVIEPSEPHLDLYRKLVEEKKDALKGISFTWRQQRSEEYLDELEVQTYEQPPRFHLVTLIHVLYYVQDMKDTIRRLHGLLEDGGILYIVVQCDDNMPNIVHTKMNEFEEDLRPILITFNEVQSALDALNLPYVAERIPLYTRANAVFDEASEEGNHLLDFLTHTKDFRKTAPDNLKDSILNLLRSQKITYEEDGQVYFKRHLSRLTITK